VRTLSVALLVVGLSPLVSCSSEPEDLTDDFYLEDACRDWVEDKLKAPSTADFGGESVQSGPDADGFYTVTGYVDAENGFGAQIRANWTCDVRVNDTDDGWVGNAALLE
jgi:hypothetical protein